MKAFCQEIYRRDRLLAAAGWFQVAVLAICLVGMVVDHRTVLGLNVWIKPAKFAVSIAIYAWTLAWILPHVTGPRWAKELIRWGTAGLMSVEILAVALQSFRGTTSHFNDATPFDEMIFSLMGMLIFFSTGLDFLLLVMFCFRARPLPPGYLWGIRAGLVGVLLASAVGVAMVKNEAHTVGGPDGGPGIPVINWSSEKGDLRIAHAIGLHALQVLPLAGYWLGRFPPTSTVRRQFAGLAVVALLYGGLFTAVLAQAFAGRPLLAAG